jgi:hypothetical protein
MKRYMNRMEGTPRPKAIGIPLKRNANNTPMIRRPRMFGSMSFDSFKNVVS